MLFPRFADTVQILKYECCVLIPCHIHNLAANLMVQILDDTRLPILNFLQFSEFSLFLKTFSDRGVFSVRVDCLLAEFFDLPGVRIRCYRYMPRNIPINPDELSGYHLRFFQDGAGYIGVVGINLDLVDLHELWKLVVES